MTTSFWIKTGKWYQKASGELALRIFPFAKEGPLRGGLKIRTVFLFKLLLKTFAYYSQSEKSPYHTQFERDRTYGVFNSGGEIRGPI